MLRRTARDGARPAAAPDFGIPSGSPRRQELESIVLESRGRYIEDDVCTSSLLYFSLSSDVGLRRLDQLLDWSYEKPPQNADAYHCFFLTARLRTLWLWRRGRLDLDRELAHRHSPVRAATIALLARAHAELPRIRKALGDPNGGVRLFALRAVAIVRDADAAPIVERILGHPDTNERERRFACLALSALGRSSDRCTKEDLEEPKLDADAPAPDAHCPPQDRWRSESRDVRTRVFINWYSDVITPISSPLDLMQMGRPAVVSCQKDHVLIAETVHEDERDALVATAAALLLVEGHPPCPRTPEELALGLMVNAPKR